MELGGDADPAKRALPLGMAVFSPTEMVDTDFLVVTRLPCN